MSLNNNPKSKPNIVFREEGDEALLFNSNSGVVKVLNKTGKFIWSKLDGKNSKHSLVREIMNAFDISDETKIKEDLDKFLAELEKMGFLDQDADR